MSEKVQITSQLARTVRDSRLLLSYAAQTGLAIDEKMLNILINAQYRVDFDEWTNQDEADFWQAFSELNVLIKPVSLESLQAVSLVDTQTYRFRFLRLFNNAYRTAMIYVVLSIVFMVLLLTTQIYWLVGEKFSRDLAEFTRQAQQLSQLEGFADGRYTEEYNTLLLKIETTRTTLMYWSTPWNGSPFLDKNDDIYRPPLAWKKYESQIQNVQEKLTTVAERLYTFKDFEFHDSGRELKAIYQREIDSLTEELIHLKTAYEKERNNYIFTEIEIKTRYVLHVLQRYVLPLLYGLLGAAAYVLRSLINDIQQETFTSNSRVKYLLRLFLGALAGVIIGFFIIPKEMRGLSMLSPMALAFLTGYNVEVVFALMDRLIQLASQKIRPPKPQTEDATQSGEQSL